MYISKNTKKLVIVLLSLVISIIVNFIYNLRPFEHLILMCVLVPYFDILWTPE